MKTLKLFFFLAFIAFAFSSCHKDNPINDSAINDSEGTFCTDVFYKKFNPDTVLHMPYLTTDYFYLKLNSDSLPDIRFSLEHDVFGPHYHDTYKVWMIGLDSLKLIETNYCNGPCNRSLDSTDYICDTSKTTSHSIYLYVDDAEMSIGCNCFSEMGFVGLKFKYADKVYYGWIRLRASSDGVYIRDYAICNCPNKPIRIGFH